MTTTDPDRPGPDDDAGRPLTLAERAARTVRSARRRRIHFDLDVTFQSHHNFYTGFTENVSSGGLFVATTEMHPIGSRFRIRFSLPEREQPVEVLAEVRWQRLEMAGTAESHDAAPGMGLRFIDLSEDDREAIQEFIRRRATLFYDDDDLET
jgi:uncharacterized protein (TIGR02266 family)